MKILFGALLAIAMLSFDVPAQAQNYTFKVISDGLPLTTDARPYSINDTGQILVQEFSNGYIQGTELVLPNGSVQQLSQGLAQGYDFTALNNNGDVVGNSLNIPPIFYYSFAGYAILTAAGNVQTLNNMPFVNGFLVLGGINNAQTTVGSVQAADAIAYGVIATSTAESSYTYPGSTGCGLTGINDGGDMVGTFYKNNDHAQFYGFVVSGTTTRQLDVPGCVDINPTAISDNGSMAGTAFTQAGFGQPREVGFVIKSGAQPVIIDYRPSAPNSILGPSGPLAIKGPYATQVFGVNSAGAIVGQFSATYGSGANAESVFIPFIGTPQKSGGK